MMSEKSNRIRLDIYLIVLLGIIGLGIALRLLYLSRPMFYDEALTYLEYGTIPLGRVIARYNTPNNHILHSVAVWFSTRALESYAPYAVRAPAFLFGVLLIPLTYFVGTPFFGKRAALLAAGLTAGLLPLIDYSVNARGYTIQLCILLLMMGIAHHVKTRSKWALWLAFAVLAALGFWTIPVMVYPMGFIAAWLFFSILAENKGAARRRLLLGFAASLLLGAILTVVLYLPVLTTFGLNALLNNDFVRPRAPTDPTVISIAPQVTSVPPGLVKPPFVQSLERLWDLIAVTLPVVLVIVLVVGVVITTVLHRRIAVAHRVPLIAAFFAWVIPFMVVYPVVAPQRQWLWTLPFFCWMAAAGWVWIAEWAASRVLTAPPNPLGKPQPVQIGLYVLLAGVLIVSMAWAAVDNRDAFYEFQTGQSPHAAAVAARLLAVMGDDDLLLTEVPHSAPIRYYMKLYNGLRDPRSNAVFNQFDSYPEILRDSAERRVFVYEDAVGTINAILATFYMDGRGLELAIQPIERYGEISLVELVFDARVPGLVLMDQPFDAPDTRLESFAYGQRYRLVQVDDATALQNTVRDQTVFYGEERGEYWTDIRIETRLQVNQYASDAPDVIIGGRGLVGDDRVYREIGVTVDADAGVASIVLLENGAITATLAQAPLTLAAGTWAHMRVDFVAEQVRVYIDEALVVESTVSGYPRGRVRLIIPGGAQITVDQLTVTTAYE